MEEERGEWRREGEKGGLFVAACGGHSWPRPKLMIYGLFKFIFAKL